MGGALVATLLACKGKHKTKIRGVKMKSSFIVMLSIIFCSLIYSQESTSHPSYALSFGVADNFRLDRFNMDIAVKKIISDKNQIRLLLSPRLSMRSNDETISGNNLSQEVKTVNLSMGVGSDYLWTLLKNEEIQMFGGTGLMATYGKDKNDRTTTNIDKTISKSETNSPFINIGIRGTLGVEWKVSKSIGIHGEYLATCSYNWSRTETISSLNGISNPTISSKSSGLTLFTGVLFGVSVYL
jgi:hypothetical protein